MQSLVRHVASREVQRGVIGGLHRSFLISSACGEPQGSAPLSALSSSWAASTACRHATTDATSSSSETPEPIKEGKGRKKDRLIASKLAKYEAKQAWKAKRFGNADGSSYSKWAEAGSHSKWAEAGKTFGGAQGQKQMIKPRDRTSPSSPWKAREKQDDAAGAAEWWKGKEKGTIEPKYTSSKASENEASSPTGASSMNFDKVARLAALTARVEAARADQPDLAFHPGLVGPASFDSTPIVFPPKSVYPPPYPVVINRDLPMTSIALGVNRWASPVIWYQNRRTGEIQLKSTALAPGRSEEEGREWVFADERNLEWVGDAVISLVMRAQLESTYPELSVAGKTIAVGRLVANDLLGHLWDESGLEAERLRVARMLLDEQVAKAKMDALKQGISADRWPSEHDIRLRVEEITRHGSKADHFESYVGACFWILGWQETERWVQALAAPYIERIARVDDGQFLESNLTRVGEVSRRVQERKLNQQKKLDEEAAESRIRTMGPLRKRAREMLRPLAFFFFPEVREDRKEAEVREEPKDEEEAEAEGGAQASEEPGAGKAKVIRGRRG